jgi:hypothetical protein
VTEGNDLFPDSYREKCNVAGRRFKERALFYTSRQISGHAPKGKRAEWDYDISGVYLVAILEGFTLEDSAPENIFARY